jgi:fermentation-respiration switch protein FrsA (DUF1100 family)
MVTMRRRTVIANLTAAAAGGLVGCSVRQPTATPPGATVPSGTVPSATPTTHAPALSATASSSLAPRTPEPYVPPPGTAPAHTFAVGVRDLDFNRVGRPLPVRVWYPTPGTPGGSPARGATPATGPFPLVLFSHGLTAQPQDYAPMLIRWARAGIVVAGPTYPHTHYQAPEFNPADIVNQPADASYVITQLLAGGPLRDHLDPGRLGAAGHSGGGITTVGLFTGARDPRLKAGVVLAGTDLGGAPFTGPPAALLFVHGKRDRTVTYAAAHAVFKAVPWSRAMLTVTNGGHLTNGREFEAVAGTSTAFLRWALYGDPAARVELPSRAAVGHVATLEDDL